MVYFFYGEEDFLIWREVNFLKKKIAEQDQKLEFYSFDCEEGLKINDLMKELACHNNLFAYKKLILIKDILALRKEQLRIFVKRLKKEINQFGQADIIITGFISGKKRIKKDLVAFLQENGKAKEFKKLNDFEIADWIKKEIFSRSQKKIELSNSLANKIAQYCQGNLWFINNEIEKIINYHSNESAIQKESLSEVLFGDKEFKIFDLVDAIGYKNKKKALEILNVMLKKGESPYYLLSMINFQVRNMAKLSAYRNQPQNQKIIAQKTGLHPFVVKKTLQQLNNHGSKNIKKIYKTLSDIDYFSKTGESVIENDLVNLIISL